MSRDGFLSRWARRKQEAGRIGQREEKLEQLAPEVEGAAEPGGVRGEGADGQADEAQGPDAITPEELASLPPVEEITDPADFSQYLRKGVPHPLRNAAMRRMWMLDATVRNYVDPALDYAYDWNIPGGVPGNGVLPAGFDAKQAADRFFSTMRGRISAVTGEFEQAEAEAAAAIQAEAALAESPLDHDVTADSSSAAPQRELGRVTEFGESSTSSGANTANADATLVVRDPAPAPPVGEKRYEIQGIKRRHGRAIPV